MQDSYEDLSPTYHKKVRRPSHPAHDSDLTRETTTMKGSQRMVLT